MKAAFAMMMFLSALILSCSGRENLAQPPAGQPAPAFTGVDINGKKQSLEDYRGRVVVVESYNLDCPFSANQYKTGAMQELQQFAVSNGAVWLVVNSVHKGSRSYRPPEEARREFAAQSMKATAWLDDSDGQIGRAYGLRTTPEIVVIDREGRLAYQGAVDDLRASSGDPRNSRNYVREALESLFAGKPVSVSQTKPYGCSVKYGS